MKSSIKSAITTPRYYVYIVLLFTLIMFVLDDIPGIPSAIRYLNDLLVAMLCVFLFFEKNIREQIKRAGIRWILLAILLYSTINILTAWTNRVYVPLVVWAVRNTYRFFLFWFACVVFLEKSDLDKLFDLLYKMQYVNLLLVAYQFFGLGLKQDALGGIFGNGGQFGLLVYSILLMSYATAKYMAGEYSGFRYWFLNISLCVISVLAEIRIYLYMLAVVVVINMVLSRNSLKKIYVVLGMVLLYFLSAALYSVVFPYVDLSPNALFAEAKSSSVVIDGLSALVDVDVLEGIEVESLTGGYNISRLGAFREIDEVFFKGDIIRNLFGYGFGNCEQSGFAIFTSDFYQTYGKLHYHWFMHQHTFLETGYAGVIGYLLILTAMLLSGYYCFRRNTTDRPILITGITMTAISFVLFIYNSALRIDYAYLIFFSLAIPAVVNKSDRISES